MPSSSESTSSSRGRVAGRLRHLVYRLRTEGGGASRDATAIGVGVFIGCSPFYGLHLILCWVVGRLLRLNRLKMYLAANVSNPFMAPFLVLAELQIGAWVRRGELHSLTIEAVRSTDPWIFGGDLLVGSAIVGGVLGVGTGLATWLSTRAGDSDPAFADLVRRASDRYVTTSITAWEFARGKLRADPLYRTVLTAGILPSGGRLADLGCGQGLMLALLAEAADDWRRGTWPESLPQPPVFDEMVGIEVRPRVASIARRALAGSAEIIEADGRHHAMGHCTAVLLFDVLHLMTETDQDRLMRSVCSSVGPDSVVLVREADASAGWRFQTVRGGNRVKAVLVGRWRQQFHFRSVREWTLYFERAGFQVARRGAGAGTPFGNLLFVLTRPERASG